MTATIRHHARLPHSLGLCALALLAGVVVSAPNVAHAQTTGDRSVDEVPRTAAPRPWTVNAHTTVGVAGGSLGFFARYGVDFIYSTGPLRVGATADTAASLGGVSRRSLAAYVGVGAQPFDRALDLQAGAVAGGHLYTDLGDGWNARTVSGGLALLPYVGARASLMVRFGRERRIGLGVVGTFTADAYSQAVPTTACVGSSGSDYYMCSTSSHTAGEVSGELGLELSVAF